MLKKHLQLLLATLLLITTMVYAQDPAPSMYLDKLIDKAEQGDVKAQYDLGFRFEMGIDVDKNYEKALYWYKKAAEQGLASRSEERRVGKECRYWGWGEHYKEIKKGCSREE